MPKLVDLHPLGHRVRRHVQHFGDAFGLMLAQQFHKLLNARELNHRASFDFFRLDSLEVRQHHVNTHQKKPMTAKSAQPNITM